MTLINIETTLHENGMETQTITSEGMTSEADTNSPEYKLEQEIKRRESAEKIVKKCVEENVFFKMDAEKHLAEFDPPAPTAVIDIEEFFELMQSYRHAPKEPQYHDSVIKHYTAVMTYILGLLDTARVEVLDEVIESYAGNPKVRTYLESVQDKYTKAVE